jgi:hypothetical protein
MLASIKSFSYLASLGLLLLGSAMAQADDTFDTKERFKNPAKIPTHIMHYLSKQAGREAMASCQEAKPVHRGDLPGVVVAGERQHGKTALAYADNQCR